MTPKEKAKQLFDKFMPLVEAYSSDGQQDNAKECVMLLIEQIETITYHYPPDYMLTTYWQEVKQEINKILI